ncbi:MAG: hypothetical protein ABIA93_00530 [Candidatus Woesearchaeota archaeon]
MQRKAQAAMEFLMTYGWAIMVVLAAIGALAYFGVLSPDRFLPEKCVINGGFSCTEYLITSTGPGFKLQNNLGVDAAIVRIDIEHKSGTNAGCPPFYYIKIGNPIPVPEDIPVDNGDSVGFKPPGYSGLPAWLEIKKASPVACQMSGKYRGTIKIVYKKSGESLTHIASGEILGSVE